MRTEPSLATWRAMLIVGSSLVATEQSAGTLSVNQTVWTLDPEGKLLKKRVNIKLRIKLECE